uniref:Transcription initiation factor IIA subunit 2 n=1 Tax=Rhabditophanes sp. KR3021 TaxID=114890 RepID=A0AC35TLF8_9BILA
MNYQLYRNTTLGIELQKTVDDFVMDGSISTELARRVMENFDKCFNEALHNRTHNRTTFMAEKLRSYRFVDNVWTFVVEKVEIRNPNNPLEEIIPRLKIVACDGSKKSG